MGGGIIQLVATGMADIHLTQNAQFSFFRAVYKRYHNFAMEPIRLEMVPTPNFGKTVKTIISKKAELLSDIFIYIKLPSLTAVSGTYVGWTNTIARAILKKVEIKIGGVLRQDLTLHDIALDIWDELTVAHGIDGYELMTGTFSFPISLETNATSETSYFAKLPYWFCRYIHSALPLVALQYTEIELLFHFRDLSECLHYDGDTAPTDVDITDACVFCNYIYLEDSEKARFAISYETEHIQQTNPKTGATTYLELPKLDSAGNQIPKVLTYLIDQWQFLGEVEVNASQTVFSVDLSNFNLPCSEILWVFRETDSETNNDWFNYSRRSDAKSFFTEAKLLLDNHERFGYKPEEYFRMYQPHIYHSKTTTRCINVYSFGLKPEDYQPAGTLNFSHVDSAVMYFNMRSGNSACKFYCYARNYNIAIITGGQFGVAWSN